jgi:hypothetical protein
MWCSTYYGEVLTVFVQARVEAVFGPLVCSPLCHGLISAGYVIAVRYKD